MNEFVSSPRVHLLLTSASPAVNDTKRTLGFIYDELWPKALIQFYLQSLGLGITQTLSLLHVGMSNKQHVMFLLLLLLASTFMIVREGFQGHMGWHPNPNHRSLSPAMMNNAGSRSGTRGQHWGMSPDYWNDWFDQPIFYRARCGAGCVKLGKGRWGCQYPAPGPGNCEIASDCAGCELL